VMVEEIGRWSSAFRHRPGRSLEAGNCECSHQGNW
jgi:hypothetical protein